MKHILLIYNLIPEDVKYYCVPVDHPDIDLIKGAHGALINIEDPTPEQEEGMDYINDAASKHSEFVKNIEHFGKLTNYEVNASVLINTPFEGLVIATFYM